MCWGKRHELYRFFGGKMKDRHFREGGLGHNTTGVNDNTVVPLTLSAPVFGSSRSVPLFFFYKTGNPSIPIFYIGTQERQNKRN